MNVERLWKDELLIELAINGVKPDRTKTVAELKPLLRDAIAARAEGMAEDVYDASNEDELLHLAIKVNDAEDLLTVLVEGGDPTASPDRVRSLLSHVSHRVSRLYVLVEGEQKGMLKGLAKTLRVQQEKLKTLGVGARYKASEFGDISSIKTNEKPQKKKSKENTERDHTEPENSDGEHKEGPRKEDNLGFGGKSPKLDFHKWGIKISGFDDKSVNSFIVEVEEKALAKGIPTKYLMLGVTEFFTGEAITWYRSVMGEVSSWEELKIALRKEFLPLDYEESLWDEIKSRKQGTKETLGMFVANMLGLFSRLSESVPEERKLRILLMNMAPFYMEKLALQKVLSIRQLKDLGRELDLSKSRMEQYSNPRSKVKPLEPEFRCKSKPVVHEVEVAEVSTPRAKAPQAKTPPAKAPKAEASPEPVQGKPRRVGCWQCGSPDHGYKFCTVGKKWDYCNRCGLKGAKSSDCNRCKARRGPGTAKGE